MSTKITVALIVLFAALSAHAEVVQFQSCPNSDPNATINCTIHEVRVDPCKEAAQGKPCRLKRGHEAGISFDYTPLFEATTMETRAYWPNQMADLPFLGMETDACKATPCPTTPGQKQTFNMRLPISKKFPVRTYDVKWKLWNDKEQDCCFIFQIKLHK